MALVQRTLIALLIHTAFVGFSSTLGLAQGWDAADRSGLIREIASAAESLDEGEFPSLEAAKNDFCRSASAVASFFDRRTDAANAQAWRAYLDLKPLIDLVESDAADLDIARKAIETRFRLVGTTPGLELSAVRDLRDSVERLIGAVRFRDGARSKSLIAKQLGSLSELITEIDGEPSPQEQGDLAAILGLLDQAGQSEGLVAGIRSRFAHPNFVISVGEPLVQSVVNRNAYQSRQVRDCILGTRIVGDASLVGMVTADVVPSRGAARLLVSLGGQVSSRNTGFNGPVRLRTIGSGNVFASRSLLITESGLSAQPVHVSATLQTQIVAIEHKLRIVRRIARKRAAEQKPNADRIALGKLKEQVGKQFDSETNQMTPMPMTSLMTQLGPLLNRLSIDEPSRLIESTDDAILMHATVRNGDQLASRIGRPPVLGPRGVAVQIHESLVDNLLAPVLAGRTVREGDLDSLIASSGLPIERNDRGEQSVAPELRQDDGDDDEEESTPFEIDFARQRPIIFEARDQTLRLGVRGTRFVQGKRELKRAIEIVAVYEPVRRTDGQMVLARKDDVEVSFSGSGSRLSVTQVGLKRTIQKKFADVFPQFLLEKTFRVPADAKAKALAGREFRVTDMIAGDGWLTVEADIR